MNNVTYERERFSRIIRAIDKRAVAFEFIGEDAYLPNELCKLFGMSDDEWNRIISDKKAFLDFLLDSTTSVKSSDEGIAQYIGVIDNDERYIILNAFVENDDVYGFVVDKTSEVHNKFKINEEIRQMRHSSFTDSLTRLTNRAGFETIVKKSLEADPNIGALAIIDMDNFKLVNDMLGHPEGDKVLKAFAEVLTGVASSDHSVVARLGGDEFVIFWSENITRDYLRGKLDELMTAVHSRFDSEYPDQRLSASVGAVLVGAGLGDYERLYESADSALYCVKENGKGHYRIK